MNNRSTFERTLRGKALGALALCAVIGAAVVGASAGPVLRPIEAPDDVTPCPDDASDACVSLWVEYYSCLADGGGSLCVVPCCKLEKDARAEAE